LHYVIQLLKNNGQINIAVFLVGFYGKKKGMPLLQPLNSWLFLYQTKLVIRHDEMGKVLFLFLSKLKTYLWA